VKKACPRRSAQIQSMRRIREVFISLLAATLVAGTLACPPDRQGEPKTNGAQQDDTASGAH
jgi:hypothetical protein